MSMPFVAPTEQPRLPDAYRAEAGVVQALADRVGGALDWPGVIAMAAPWVEQVRRNPAPFWAMESLLREYPITSAEGLALMRLAEALLRVPDAPTAIALTADQLGRADFDGASEGSPHKMLAALSASAISMSKRFLPDAERESGLLKRLGAQTVVAATVRALQLLGRQFVLGQHIGEAPGFPPQEVLDLRIRLIAEEFAELLEAAGYPYVVRVCRRGGGLWDGDGPALFDKEAFDSHTADFPAFIRELLDLEKTVLGTHIACGVDPAEPWARVCAANMAKEMRGGQPVKPSGWQAPDIAGALREQGWQGGAE